MTLVARRTAKMMRDASIADSVASLINDRALREVTPDEYIVRSAIVCNDIVDNYMTQFTPDALKKIAQLLPGKKLMRNHNVYESEDLPVGTWIDARVVKEKGVTSVLGTFFMMKAGDVDGLIPRIDAAIIDEISLSWYPIGNCCSICGNALSSMDCEHAPGKSYGGRVCVMSMPDLRDVIEASLVWKGGQKETSIMMPRSADIEAEDINTVMQRMMKGSLGDDVEAMLRTTAPADDDEIVALLRAATAPDDDAENDDLARLFEREDEEPGIDSLFIRD